MHKFFEIAYLVIAAILFVEGILAFSSNTKKALLYFFFALMAGFMFFFKKKFREKRFKK
ncbi:MAG: hypothetical protein V3U80_03150 [Flavobacteriaceae bacterium]